MRLLLVEDDSFFAQITAEYLNNDNGFEVPHSAQHTGGSCTQPR